MINKVFTLSDDLSHNFPVTIETNISDKGLPVFEIFGLVSKSIEESKKRVFTAFENSNIEFPLKNIKVNIAPANISKSGTHYDLPIALSIIGDLAHLDYSDSVFIGELSFDGSVKRVERVGFLVLSAIEKGYKKVYIPTSCADEIAFSPQIEVHLVNSLQELVSGKLNSLQMGRSSKTADVDSSFVYSNIRGHYYAKKVLGYSLVGHHHLLLEGPPGVGKSMLAKSMSELAPALLEEEYLEVTKMYSYSGLDSSKSFNFKRPFRNPHSSASYSSIFGSYSGKIIPGEVSLANNGILFLDEFPEFNRLVIEGLRSPMEDRVVTISRASKKFTFNSDFLLVATKNPCKCGFFNHSKVSCRCSSGDVLKYSHKISGPVVDRIDIHLKIDENKELNTNEDNSYSNLEYYNFKERIANLHLHRKKLLNSDKSSKNNYFEECNIITQKHIPIKVSEYLTNELNKYSLSSRSYFKILNLAFTISIFNNREIISLQDLIESISLNKVKKFV